jgi:hypothetical protein
MSGDADAWLNVQRHDKISYVEPDITTMHMYVFQVSEPPLLQKQRLRCLLSRHRSSKNADAETKV